MELRRLLISLAALSPAFLYSQVSTSIEERFSPMPFLTEKAWENPCLLGFEYTQNLTKVGGSFFNSDKERFGEFKAETYMHLKTVTINAQAHYDNGAKHNVRFCENADISKVYPYLTYDAVGGNQNLERYSFGGDVSVKVNDQWNVGAKASYDAGLYSRNVDPRPKIVTGNFNIGAGGSYIIGHYALGLSAEYEKYKQSCDIMFKSELGESKIYHLTGLGTHYNRFSAQGTSSYYSGNSYGSSLTLLPIVKGIYLHAAVNRENITQILADLNNLPMSKTVNTSYGFQAGYKTAHWGLTASADFERRHGYENIFGDAATGQYPQIGSLGMFIANANSYSLKGAVNIPANKVVMYLNPSLGYHHYREIYREPRKELSVDNLIASIECKAITKVKDKVIIYGCIAYQYIEPLSHNLKNISTDNPELQPYLDILKQGYIDASSQTHNFEISIGSDFLISKGMYAIGLDISYIKNKLVGDHSLFSASFKF